MINYLVELPEDTKLNSPLRRLQHVGGLLQGEPLTCIGTLGGATRYVTFEILYLPVRTVKVTSWLFADGYVNIDIGNVKDTDLLSYIMTEVGFAQLFEIRRREQNPANSES